MRRLTLLCALTALAAALNACATPTAPTPNRPAVRAQEDTGAFCGWVVPNGRC